MRLVWDVIFTDVMRFSVGCHNNIRIIPMMISVLDQFSYHVQNVLNNIVALCNSMHALTIYSIP